MSTDPKAEATPPDDETGLRESAAPGVTNGARAENFIIPLELAQATLDYLASRPYREVYGLVRAFEGLQPLPPAHTETPRQ